MSESVAEPRGEDYEDCLAAQTGYSLNPQSAYNIVTRHGKYSDKSAVTFTATKHWRNQINSLVMHSILSDGAYNLLIIISMSQTLIHMKQQTQQGIAMHSAWKLLATSGADTIQYDTPNIGIDPILIQ